MIYKKRVAVSLMMAVLLIGCATPVMEHIRLPGDLPGWKLGHKQRDRLTKSTRWEYIPEQEYISNWSSLFTIQYYDTKQDDPEAFMDGLKAKMARVCPHLQAKILDKQAGSILYEWRIQDCTRYKDQHQLARIIRGKEGLHRVAYTEKTPQIPSEVYQQWKKKLLGARLETGGH